MKRIYISLLLALMALPMMAEDQQAVSTSMDPSRYDFVQSTIVRRQSFLLDKYTGRVWVMVKDINDVTSFEEVYIDELDTTAGTEVTYKLFLGGTMARDCFLINTKTGQMWQYVKYNDDLLFFQKKDRSDGAIHPELVAYLRKVHQAEIAEAEENEKMKIVAMGYSEDVTVVEQDQLRKEFVKHYQQYKGWRSLDSQLFLSYRNVYNWVRRYPSAEKVANMKVINRYMEKFSAGIQTIKIEKQLGKCTTVQEEMDTFLEYAAAAGIVKK